MLSAFALPFGCLVALLSVLPLAGADQLPVTPAETLSGAKLNFPAAFAGRKVVCVFSFSREAGDAVPLWMTRLTESGADALSVANLEAAPGFIRGVIRGGMRKATPKTQLDRALIMTKDDKAWRQALGLKQEKLPLVILLDSAGRPQWSYEGVWNEAAARDLKTKLEAAR
jgi:hypothetical protein